MKVYVLAAMIALASNISAQNQQPTIAHSTSVERAQVVRQVGECNKGRLLAHIEHDGLSFSIQVCEADESFLKIVIPEKTGSITASSGPVVHLKVLMADDAIIEGPAELVPGAVSNGGWVEVRYRFALRKNTVVEGIHSVTIRIGDQSYTAYPF
jgi:hypothetical protein